MTVADVRELFVREIEHRARADRYIDRDEEREIVQIGLQLGLGIEKTRAELHSICIERGYFVETAAVRAIQIELRRILQANPRGLNGGDYAAVLGFAREKLQEHRGELEIRKIAMAVLEDTPETRLHLGWFGNWFERERRALGLSG